MPLLGRVSIGNGARASAELCLTSEGLFLVAALDRERGMAIDLEKRDDLRWSKAAFGGRLKVGELELGTVPGRGDTLEELIALGRLRPNRSVRPPAAPRARHVETMNDVELAFLGRLLEPEELLLGWLETASSVPIHSNILKNAEGELRFVLTERRQLLIALSAVGDLREMALEQAPLGVERRRGRASVRLGPEHWMTTFGNLELYEELAGILPLQPLDRLREVARLNWLRRDEDPAFVAFARRLLETASARGDALSASALAALDAEQGRRTELSPVVERLKTAAAPDRALADLAKSFRIGPAAGQTLVARLRELGRTSEPWALTLHERLHADARDRDSTDQTLADVALAEHLLALGERERARVLLEARLAALPRRPLEELVPARDADLTRGGGARAITVRIQELLSEARRVSAGPDAMALVELARLQPLVLERMRALSAVAEGEIGRRAARALAALEAAGLADRSLDSDTGSVLPLPASLLERRLRHPLVREGEELLGKLQALLAAVPAPDHAVLRDYCEQLSPERHPEAARALSDAARALGVPDVRAYVSRGNKSVGLCAYEGQPPFVLVGVRHLEGDPAFQMTPAELRFAIAAEVAHLRYGHARVTSSEVWAGALSKSKLGLDFALGVLPVFKGWKMADRLGRVMSRIPVDPAQRLIGSVRSLGDRLRRSPPELERPRPYHAEGLSRIHEQLVAAHRVMQLTADRAGLLLSGDLVAALRALLLVRADYRELLAEAESAGLDGVLGRRDAEGEMQHQHLAVRVGALIAFYLSDDYTRLRAELLGSE